MGKYRPVNECFKKVDKITASHKLFNDFKSERNDTTKFIFYLWLMENQLKSKFGKDDFGDSGWGLEYVPKKGIDSVIPCGDCSKQNSPCRTINCQYNKIKS